VNRQEKIDTTLTVVYYVILVGVTWWTIKERPPVMMVVWRDVARLCQWLAWRFGCIGLAAEKAYWRATEASRL